LKGYGVRPRTIRIGEQTAKGYVKEELRETLRRYIPKSELEAVRADLVEGILMLPQLGAERSGRWCKHLRSRRRGKEDEKKAERATSD